MAKKKLSAIELILKKLAKLFEVSLAGKQDVLSFNTSYDASTNKAATMSDMPSVMGASGSGHASGLVPDPGATAGTGKYLREDGTWQVPAGGSDISIAATGSSTKPVYVSATNTFTACSTYAGGTKVTLNGTNKGASTASFYAPTAGGTSGQYLMSNGSGEPTWASITGSTNIAAVGSSTSPVYVSAKNTFTACSTYAGGTKVTLNGSNKGASTASFYAPTSAGTSGQFLKSNGSGAPSWITISFAATGSATTPIYLSADNTFAACSLYAGGTKVTLNGSNKGASTASFYAPTDAGASGQILKSNGSGAPSWGNFVAAGSATKPVYLSADNTFAACSLYAGGTAVTLNGKAKDSSTVSFYAPTSAGTSGQFLMSNGSGAPSWSNFVTAKGSSNTPVYISGTNTFSDCSLYAGGTAVTLNGKAKDSSTASFYAPTSAGTSGKILMSNGSGAPSWVNFVSATGDGNTPVYISGTDTFSDCSLYAGGTAVTLNGKSKAASTASFYAPTTSGTSGKILMSNGSGAPSWVNFVSATGDSNKPVYISGTDTFSECSKYAGGTKVTLNGTVKAATDASFYAPTTSGTSGKILMSNGSNSAPSWVNFVTAKGSGNKPVYISGTDTFSDCSLYAGGSKVTLNGIVKAATDASFYAPTTAGTSGKYLMSNGSGSAPTWTTISFPGQEKMSVSTITAANVPSTLTFNTFYRITDNVGTKTFTLPAPSSSYAGMIMIHFKTSTSTSITISSSKTVKYCSTYSITTSKTYLLTCIWNGNLWMIMSDIIN